MVSFPNAKINLGLNVVSKRSDGYHDIDSCFYPIPWNDVLEIISSDKLKFTCSGIPIPGKPEDNLCLSAYHLLKKDFDLPAVHIHLHKVIPIGAGLGGGSSDASHVLTILNEKFELTLNKGQLENYAKQLGSDCPFFIENKPVLATGIGTEFSPLNIDLKGKYLVILMPNIHISTSEAYTGIAPKQSANSVRAIIETHSITDWKTLLHNDFEDSIFPNHPSIKEIKELFYNDRATYASMTGSGAAVFGIFERPTEINSQKDWTLFTTAL